MKETNEITAQIINAAMKVHSALGPGLLESAYEICLVHELRKREFEVQTQVVLPVEYDGVKLDAGYRIDLLVEKTVVVELKAVEKMNPVFEAQLLSYLKLSQKQSWIANQLQCSPPQRRNTTNRQQLRGK